MRRYPYHRYLKYQVFNRDGVDEIIEHMLDLEYIPPRREDVEELRSRLLSRPVTREIRRHHDVLFFDDTGDAVDQMRWMVSTPVVRTAAERLLLDKVHARHVATILGLKFDERLTIKAVDFFRDGFWDTAALTPVDFGEYFRLGGQRKPEPPPDSVSLPTRPAYSQWKQGLHPSEEDLGPDAMVREIQVDAFMRFKETGDPKTARAWAELVLKTASARRGIAEAKLGSGRVPTVQNRLVYPEVYVPTLGELHSEYSQDQSGTGDVSEAMGRREKGD